MAESKYDPKYCQEIIDFFTVKEAFSLVPLTTSFYKPGKGQDKGAVKTERLEIVPIPPKFFEQFARSIGINPTTLYDWEKAHLEFKDAMNQCRELRSQQIISGGLMGIYDARYCALVSKNFPEVGFKDEVINTFQVDSKDLNEIWKQREKTLKGKIGKSKSKELPGPSS
jgi:hypothetical protein